MHVCGCVKRVFACMRRVVLTRASRALIVAKLCDVHSGIFRRSKSHQRWRTLFMLLIRAIHKKSSSWRVPQQAEKMHKHETRKPSLHRINRPQQYALGHTFTSYINGQYAHTCQSIRGMIRAFFVRTRPEMETILYGVPLTV